MAPQQDQNLARSRLREAVEDSHRRGRQLLDDEAMLPAVGWLSRQDEAFERVVISQVGRLAPDGHGQVKQFRRLSRQITGRLRQLERLHSGDAAVATADGRALADQLRPLLARHQAEQLALVDQLPDDLGRAAGRDLAADYQAALRTAPTRPHPYAPRSRILAGPRYRFDRRRDRLRDTLDNRSPTAPAPATVDDAAGLPAERRTPAGAGSATRPVRSYLLIMGTCLTLIVVAWTVVRLISVPAAVALSVVAMVLPPVAAIVANAGRD